MPNEVLAAILHDAVVSAIHRRRAMEFGTPADIVRAMSETSVLISAGCKAFSVWLTDEQVKALVEEQ